MLFFIVKEQSHDVPYLSVWNGLTGVGIDDDALGSHVGSLHVLEHGLFVMQPLAGDLLGGEVLATGQLQGDLEGVGVDVVEVLHAAGHVVPLGAVRDSAGEVIAA